MLKHSGRYICLFLTSVLQLLSYLIECICFFVIEKHAIYCNPGYSATFGGGHDIFIGNNANVNTTSYSNLGHSYKHPQFTSGSNEAKTLLAGSYNFQVQEIEAFMKE